MIFFRTALAVVLLFMVSWTTQAQVRISLSSERSNYLLFENSPFTVEVTNESGEPLNFSSDPKTGHSWLAFIILRVDGSKIRAESTFSTKDRSLQQGESFSIRVNITPYYSLRETGQYTIQAVVKPDGMNSFITSKLTFNVSKGENIWQRDRMVDGKRTTYSIIRFLEDETSCYIRVEEPEENLVLCTTRTGSLLANSAPTTLFDANGELHLLQSLAARTYRYSKISEGGKIVFQEDRVAGATIPTMASMPDGSVQFTGGVNQKELQQRPSLSDDQGGKVMGSAEQPFSAPPGFVPPKK